VLISSQRFPETIGRITPISTGAIPHVGLDLQPMTTLPLVLEQLELAEALGNHVAQHSVAIDQLRAANQELTLQIAGRRALERQLSQAQKMEAIGQLSGGLAHDLNNLLAIVIGNLDILREQWTHEPDSYDLAGDALGAALRGAELVRQILAFARRQPLAPEPCDVNQAVCVILGLLHRTFGADIAIDLRLAPNLPPALVDRVQLESAITNLVTNARHAMPKGGLLTIRTSMANPNEEHVTAFTELTPGDYAVIEVVDTGTGMPTAMLDHIFEPFFTTKEPGQGTGLGLSMVFGFVAQSGGHINVASKLGVGSNFRLYLPFAEPTATSIGQVIHPTAHGRNKTILVVEHDAGLRLDLLRLLTSAGYHAVEAGDARAALDRIKTDMPIDLLLTDIVMPGGIDGHGLARLADQLRPGLKTLLTSGHAGRTNREAEAESKLPGPQKPMCQGDLLRIVHEMLHDHGICTEAGPYPTGRWSGGHTNRSNRSESALAKAERHVREGEERIARQIAIVERLEGALHNDARRARALLVSLETSVSLARSQLRATR
jgi:signal transduction histidine kinase